MNNTKLRNIILLSIAGLFIVCNLFFYQLGEAELAVITQFGQAKRIVSTAGLKLKVPFVEKVNRFEKRLLEWDGKPNQVPTFEKRYINVDTFARWRISDPLKFMESLATEESAHSRLDDIINSAVRNQISSNLLIEAVRNSNRKMAMKVDIEGDRSKELMAVQIGRNKIEEEIIREASTSTAGFGIELVDVRIKRINYTEQVREKVYERMIEERLRVAAEYRSEGEGTQMRIRGEIENEVKSIKSDAYKTSQQIKGDADAKAVKIYADAYSLDPDFYAFSRTLESYKDNLTGKDLILSTGNKYLSYIARPEAGE
ncbi:MAG: protease modulator HflC [Phycisphaerae bacterium]|jgi:membrane protease subunit HflC